MNDNPYTDDKIDENNWFRTFDVSVAESDEYVWHQDLKDRTITVIEGEGWSFQFDDEIPQVINRYDNIFIPKMVYHRLIKGTTDLKIKITED